MTCPKNCPGPSAPHHCMKASDGATSLRAELQALGKKNKPRSRHVPSEAKREWNKVVAESSNVGTVAVKAAQSPVMSDKVSTAAGAKSFTGKSYNDQVDHMHHLFFVWNEKTRLERSQEKAARDAKESVRDARDKINAMILSAQKRMSAAETSSGCKYIKSIMNAHADLALAHQMAQDQLTVVDSYRLVAAYHYSNFTQEYMMDPFTAHRIAYDAYKAASRASADIWEQLGASGSIRCPVWYGADDTSVGRDETDGYFPDPIMSLLEDVRSWAKDPRLSSVDKIVFNILKTVHGILVSTLAGETVMKFDGKDVRLTYGCFRLAAAHWCGAIAKVVLVYGDEVVARDQDDICVTAEFSERKPLTSR